MVQPRIIIDDIILITNAVRAISCIMSTTTDPKLLEALVCPLTKDSLRYDASAQELISDRAGLAYPIRDGIPVMRVDEARVLEEREIRHD